MSIALKYGLLFTGIWAGVLAVVFASGTQHQLTGGLAILLGCPVLLLPTVSLGLYESRKKRSSRDRRGFFTDVRTAARPGGYFALFSPIVLYFFLTVVAPDFIEERNERLMEQQAKDARKESPMNADRERRNEQAIQKAFTPFKIATVTLLLNVFLTLVYALGCTFFLRAITQR